MSPRFAQPAGLSRVLRLAWVALLGIPWLAYGPHDGEGVGPDPITSALTKQEKATSFFDVANQLTVRITMDPAQWQALATALPLGGPEYVGDRYPWHKADTVAITPTQFPGSGTFSFANVGIKKKGYWGSQSQTKPAFHLKYDEYDPNNEAPVESLIGTKYLMFNNSKEDGDYVRQCLGYRIFKDARLPYARCNFAHVFVHAPSGALVADLGVYVNVEPVKTRFIENNFAGNSAGNLYEFESGEDFDPSMFFRIDFKGFSPYQNKKDLALAATQIAAGDYASVVDVDQFMRYWAAQIMLKNFDTYAWSQNNIYVYNDVVAVAAPNPDNVNFKFIPYGIDKILIPSQWYGIYNYAILSSKLAADPSYMWRLRSAVHVYLNTVFGCRSTSTVVLPHLNASASVVDALLAQSGGGPVNPANLTAIGAQITGARAAMRTVFGFYFTSVDADFECDGKTDWTVWRPSAKFYTRLSSTGAVTTPIFGVNGDTPVIGDFDGDGKSDYALWRPSTGAWDVLHSATGQHVYFSWGTSGDVPVPRTQN